MTGAAATLDLALDALTVERTAALTADAAAAARRWAAAAKMGGISLGAVIGGGALVALWASWGWRGALAALAGLMALSIVPTMALVRLELVAGGQRTQPALAATRGPHRVRLGALLAQPDMAQRLLRLTLLGAALMALFNFNRLVLIDMGVPLARVGSLLGTVAPLANLGASLLAPSLARRLGLRSATVATCAGCAASGALVWLGIVSHSTALVLAGSVLVTAAAAALYVVLGSAILAWAAGAQAATDYALLYSLGRLLGTAALLVLPGLAAQVGWPAFQAGVVLAFALAAWWLVRLLPAAALGSPGRAGGG